MDRSLPIKLLIFGSVFIFYFLFARYTDNIPVSSGLGWDGQLYGKLAIDFEKTILSGEVPKHKLGKIVPSAICYYTLPILKRDHNYPNVILFFQGLNALSLSVALFYWLGICKTLKFSSTQIILGSFFCFVNFIFVKLYSFYPVLTDYFTYALTMAGFYYWLKGYTLRFFLVVLITNWTWTQLAYPFMIMLIFPFKIEKYINIDITKYFYISKYLNNKNIFIFSVFLSFIVLYDYINDPITDPYLTKVNNPLSLFLSFIEINLLFFITLKLPLFCILETVYKEKFILVSITGLLLSLTIYTLTLISYEIIDVKDDQIGNFEILRILFHHIFKFPFISTFSHIILFSPIILLVYIPTIKPFEALQNFGIGFSFFLMFCIPLIFNSQTRHLLHTFPIYSILFLKIFKINKFSLISFIILQSILSFFYLSFYSNGEFDDNFFLSFFGFSMSKDYYPYFVILGLLVLGYSYRVLLKSNNFKSLQHSSE